MDEVTEIMEFIQRGTGIQTDIIWGNGYDESLGNSLSVTIVATGLSSEIGVGDLETEPESESFELDTENQLEDLSLQLPEEEIAEEDQPELVDNQDEIPFEVNGESMNMETETDNRNRFVLEDEAIEAESETVPPRRKKKWVQSTIGGLFENKSRNQ